MTTKNNEIEQIKNSLLVFFQGLDETNEELFKSVTHQNVRTVNIGNSNEIFVFTVEEIIEYTITGLRNAIQKNPGFFSRREEIDIDHITVHEIIASAEVSYKMVMPESVGYHRIYFHLAKENGKWMIVNIIDRGLEKGS